MELCLYRLTTKLRTKKARNGHLIAPFSVSEHFNVNAIYHEHFRESIWRSLEKHLFYSLKDPVRTRFGGPKIF